MGIQIWAEIQLDYDSGVFDYKTGMLMVICNRERKLFQKIAWMELVTSKREYPKWVTFAYTQYMDSI